MSAPQHGTTDPPGEAGEPVIIGLTGPIGCGKSTVAAMLSELGGIAIDADALAREVTSPGRPALGPIRERFGDGVFSAPGVLDRAALAAVVFTDPAALADLEAIVHPDVRRLVEARLDEARRQGDPFVSIEAIKLVEGGLAGRCDEVWLVTCPEALQRQRLAARGMPPADVERRLLSQGSDLAARLRPAAQRCLETSGTKAEVRERVEDALADLLAPRFAGLPWGPVERP